VGVNATLTLAADSQFLNDIRAGYKADSFCKQFMEGQTSVLGVRSVDGLWCVGDRLLIPRSGTCREDLFRLAHDALGHFGADKAYATLRDYYYWPNMRRDLVRSYIPGCADCQRNKSSMVKPAGPLHPLPIPDGRGSSVALDFIGPLPKDEEGFDCILSMTDRLGSDIRIIPTTVDINAEQLAMLFFNNWYCENGLPDEFVCDRDKLFVSKFRKALHKLTGVHLKMSSAYHPESDGSSERSNKNDCTSDQIPCPTGSKGLGSVSTTTKVPNDEQYKRIYGFLWFSAAHGAFASRHSSGATRIKC
jgi:Integrase zinc binding domain